MRSFAVSLMCALLPLCGALAEEPETLPATIRAVGITGAGAVAQVGRFHPGGPLHENETFAAFTEPDRVLHAERVLVASGSNYGAPLALPDEAEGSVLSLDTAGPVLVVPADFAAGGGQASAADRRIQLYAAQSPAFINGIHTPGAASAKHASVSNALGISLNNAFGRVGSPTRHTAPAASARCRSTIRPASRLPTASARSSAASTRAARPTVRSRSCPARSTRARSLPR